jgi:hypothetical protein
LRDWATCRHDSNEGAKSGEVCRKTNLCDDVLLLVNELNELIGCLAGIVDQSEACSSATLRQLSKEMRLDQPKGSAIAVGNHPPRTPKSKTVRLEPQFKKLPNATL